MHTKATAIWSAVNTILKTFQQQLY